MFNVATARRNNTESQRNGDTVEAALHRSVAQQWRSQSPVLASLACWQVLFAIPHNLSLEQLLATCQKLIIPFCVNNNTFAIAITMSQCSVKQKKIIPSVHLEKQNFAEVSIKSFSDEIGKRYNPLYGGSYFSC